MRMYAKKLTGVNQQEMKFFDNRKYNAEEYFDSFPETNRHFELREGRIIEFDSPSITHQEIKGALLCAVYEYLKANSLPDELLMLAFDVKLDEYNIVQPDILIIRDLSKLDEHRCYGAPEWVIEILSDEDSQDERRDDLIDKLALYCKYGACEYWIVDPKNEKTLVYFFEKSDFPNIYTFDTPVPVGIYGGDLTLNIKELIL